MPPCVSVIIAAYDAENMLARAIRSALAEPETAQVIVVDDASNDRTSDVARTEAKRDARVHLIALQTNQGPAAARNHALDAVTAPFIAVLDSDDVFLPGRLARLLACKTGEIVADNIAFVTERTIDELPDQDWTSIAPDFEPLSATQFVAGNLHKAGVARGELGFLKPLLSREFLIRNGLRYDPALRLGEDYDLYIRILLAGGTMHLTRRPGYGAVVRQTSLSAQHGASELSHLHDRLEGHLRSAELAPDLIEAMNSHLKQVRNKRDHRAFLELRRTNGASSALRYAFGARHRLWPIAMQIARDKLKISTMASEAAPERGVRLLLPTQPTVSVVG